MKQTKDDLEYLTIAFAGAMAIRTPNSSGFKNPYLASSNASDAFLIGAWCQYHTGHPPERIHKARGYTWEVEARQIGVVTGEVKSAHDQRNGFRNSAGVGER